MGRSRVIALLIACAALAVMASWLHQWAVATPSQVRSAGYTATYVASTQWRHGEGNFMYDRRAQTDAERRLGVSPGQLGNRFVNPPVAAVAAAPFSLLPLGDAYRAWSFVQLLLLLAAIAIAVRTSPWPAGQPVVVRLAAGAFALAGAGGAVLVLEGQWDGVSALGLAAAYASWRRGRPGSAGALLTATALLAKPHLVLGLAGWLVGRRDRRTFAGAGAGLLLISAGTLAAGPALAAAFLGAPGLSSSVTPVRMLLGFTGLFGSWLGDSPLTYGLAAGVGAIAFGACILLGAAARRSAAALEASLGGAVVLSLLISPHLLVQDLAVLGVPFIWAMARSSEGDGARAWPGLRSLALLGGWVALDLAARTDLGNYMPAPPGRLVPWVLLAGGLAACSACGVARIRRLDRVSRAQRPGLGTVTTGVPH